MGRTDTRPIASGFRGFADSAAATPAALEAVAFTCKSLGAVAFLDIADYQQDADREMREAIERFLGS